MTEQKRFLFLREKTRGRHKKKGGHARQREQPISRHLPHTPAANSSASRAQTKAPHTPERSLIFPGCRHNLPRASRASHVVIFLSSGEPPELRRATQKLHPTPHCSSSRTRKHRRTSLSAFQHRRATLAPSNTTATSTSSNSGEPRWGAQPHTPTGERIFLCPRGTLLLLPRYLIACYLA